MRVWRIGSQWGDYDLVPLFRAYSIAFANIEEQIDVISLGDLVAITKGQSIIALGQVNSLATLSSAVPDENDDLFKENCFIQWMNK